MIPPPNNHSTGACSNPNHPEAVREKEDLCVVGGDIDLSWLRRHFIRTLPVFFHTHAVTLGFLVAFSLKWTVVPVASTRRLPPWRGGFVFVLATTTSLRALDPSILRPGRLETHIHLGNPDLDGRERILEKCMGPMPVDGKRDLCQWLASVSSGMSPAMLVNICQEAAFVSLREDVNNSSIQKKHFVEALENCKRITVNESFKCSNC